MSDKSLDHHNGSAKRSLPSWISSKESGSKPRRNKHDDACDDTSDGAKRKGKGNAQTSSQFSKLLEGVVFALSGLVHPERNTVRSQALEMGAEYRTDWSPDCTLLVCAFPNTPKFRQVVADCGTIVSKEWISECYSQKKLVDMESFLMHAGKPWRKNNHQPESNKGQKNASLEEPKKQTGRKSAEKLSGSAVSKETSNSAKDHFSPSKMKEWALDDLNKTVSWLESQEEKPEASEVKAIAAEGIITCLQDVIESLKENKDIRLVMEQWMFVPRVVKELVELESGSKKGAISKEKLCELAITRKKAYQNEFDRLDSSLTRNKRKAGTSEVDDAGFESDRTIEMTEEEIEIACKQLGS